MDNVSTTWTSYQEPANNGSVSVSTSSILVTPARQGAIPRKSIVILNISPNATDIITLNLGASQAVANVGIVLRQYDTFTDSAEGDWTHGNGYLPFQGTINAICATATGVLSLSER